MFLVCTTGGCGCALIAGGIERLGHLLLVHTLVHLTGLVVVNLVHVLLLTLLVVVTLQVLPRELALMAVLTAVSSAHMGTAGLAHLVLVGPTRWPPKLPPWPPWPP